jgi:arylsulfatase A-like enzyme
LVFPNAYTPAPEAAAACMTILTGVHPLRHGFLGTRQGPLPREYDTLAQVLQERHYATAAFTEGEGPDQRDLVFGAGFERGFELFDPSYPAAETGANARTGSAATVAKVQAWIAEHADRQYFVFARLRELGDPRWCDRYAPGFVTNPAALVPVDVYDSALAYLDRQVGELIKALRATDAAKNTCIVITSTYGPDFSSRETALATVGLSESSLRVPLLLHIPNLKKEQRPGLVALEDIAPTLLTLAHTGLDYLVDGKELIQNPAERAPISLFGDPLALSIRIDRWRFSWQSGRAPFAANPTGQEYVIELYDVVQARKRGQKINEMAKYPDFATRYRARLNVFLDANLGAQRHSP